MRYPRPEVGDPEVELACNKGGNEESCPHLMARPVIVFDQLLGHEIRVVVRHTFEEVAQAPPGDDGVVERVPEDGGSEEAVDSIPQPSRRTVEGAEAGRADEDELSEEPRAAYDGGHDERRRERAGDEVGLVPDLLPHEVLDLRGHVPRPVTPSRPLRHPTPQE